MRPSVRTMAVVVVCLMLALPARGFAQGFGLGARMSMVKADTDGAVETDSVRFTGGQIRVRPSPRIGLEVSLDRHSETFDALNQRVVDTPLQTSMLLYLAQGAFAPYLVGGPGWYKHRVESLDDDSEVSSSK